MRSSHVLFCSPGNKDTLLQNIQTVASLDPLKMPNNIAFNVKVVPGPHDTPAQALNTMLAATGATDRLGPDEREARNVDAIRA